MIALLQISPIGLPELFIKLSKFMKRVNAILKRKLARCFVAQKL